MSTAATDQHLVEVVTTWTRRVDRGVLFDFNGSLSDDEPILRQLFGEIFEDRLGWVLTDDQYRDQLAGRSDREIVEIVVAEVGRHDDEELIDALLADRCSRYAELVAEHSPIRSSTRETVDLLRHNDIPLGIVTGASRIDVNAVLSSCGLIDAFAVIVADEDVERGKPHPDGYLQGATLLGVSPMGVLTFEDSIFGATAARAAGMTCIGVAGTVERERLAEVADVVADAITPAPFLAAGLPAC